MSSDETPSSSILLALCPGKVFVVFFFPFHFWIKSTIVFDRYQIKLNKEPKKTRFQFK